MTASVEKLLVALQAVELIAWGFARPLTAGRPRTERQASLAAALTQAHAAADAVRHEQASARRAAQRPCALAPADIDATDPEAMITRYLDAGGDWSRLTMTVNRLGRAGAGQRRAS